MKCPKCEGERIVQNGSIHNGKPKYWCKGCGRQFVADPQPYPISAEKREMVERLLLERISLAGMARVVGVSKRWVQYYVNAKYAAQTRQVKVIPKKTRLTIACDELWSFVGKRRNKVWVWYGLLHRPMASLSRCVTR